MSAPHKRPPCISSALKNSGRRKFSTENCHTFLVRLPARRGSARRSLCASLRMERSTVPCSPTTKTAHTSSSAQYSSHPLLHSPCRCRDVRPESSWKARRVVDGPAAKAQRSTTCSQSSEFIVRYRRSTASATAHAESSRARSGIATRATAVHARCPRSSSRTERFNERRTGASRARVDCVQRPRGLRS